MDFNDYMAKQKELDAMKGDIKMSFVTEYQKKKEELKKMEEEFKKLFGESIENSTKLTIEDLNNFIEAITENPDIKTKDLQAKLQKHTKTVQKLLKNWIASDKTLANLKTLLKVA